MTCEIREICGDWALDMNFPFETVTIYFNSRQNALNVKRILEVDKSIPNCATICDMQEVVRCRDCKYWQDSNGGYPYNKCKWYGNETPDDVDFCSYGQRKDEE